MHEGNNKLHYRAETETSSNSIAEEEIIPIPVGFYEIEDIAKFFQDEFEKKEFRLSNKNTLKTIIIETNLSV